MHDPPSSLFPPSSSLFFPSSSSLLFPPSLFFPFLPSLFFPPSSSLFFPPSSSLPLLPSLLFPPFSSLPPFPSLFFPPSSSPLPLLPLPLGSDHNLKKQERRRQATAAAVVTQGPPLVSAREGSDASDALDMPLLVDDDEPGPPTAAQVYERNTPPVPDSGRQSPVDGAGVDRPATIDRRVSGTTNDLSLDRCTEDKLAVNPPVPFLDFITNTMVFIESMLTNSNNVEHRRLLMQENVLDVMLHVYGLHALPLNFVYSSTSSILGQT